MYNPDNVNQKTDDQVVGNGVDTSILGSVTTVAQPKTELIAAMIMNSDELWDYRSDALIDAVPTLFLEILEKIEDRLPINRVAMVRQKLLARATSPPVFDERLWHQVVDMSTFTTPFANMTVQQELLHPRSRPIEITGPRSIFPVPEDDVVFDHTPPSGTDAERKPIKNKPKPLGKSDRGLNAEIEAPIYDLDNRSTQKRLASYRHKVQVNTPKEERDRLKKLSRDARYVLKDPTQGVFDPLDINSQEYEAQMNFNHYVGPTPALEDMVNRVMIGFSTLTEGGVASVDGLAAGLKDVIGSVNNSVFNKDSLTEVFVTGLTKVLWCIPLVAAAYYAVTSLNSGKYKEFSVGLAAILALLLPQGMWDSIKSLWPGNRDVNGEIFYDAQMGCFEPATLAHLLTAGLTFMTCGKSDFLGIAKDFTRAMPHYSRSVSGWKDLAIFVVSHIEKFVNYIRTTFGYNKIALYQSGAMEVDKWCNKVMEVTNASNTGGDLMTPENVEHIISLRNEGKDLADMFRFTPEASPMLHRYLGYLDDICRTCSAAMHMAKGGRAPPVVLALTGEPGVGKTFLAKFITSYVISSMIDSDRATKMNFNFDSQVFQKGTTEYWNGYCGQLAIIVDDFAQSVPVAGMDNDYIDLIRMNSSWSYPLNFADLENKGKNFFCSKFVLLTTNIKNINSCSTVITKPEAITRRIDFGYEVTVHPDFKDGDKISILKVDQYEKEHGEFPYHAWILHKKVFAIAEKAVVDNTRSYTLQEALDDVALKISSNEQYYSSTNDSVKRMLGKKYGVEYTAQSGSTFEDHLLQRTYQIPRRLPTISFLKLHSTYVDVVSEMCTFKGMLASFFESPLVKLGLVATGACLLKWALTAVVKQIFKWFKTPEDGDNVLQRSLLKKSKIPSTCVAQALDVFRPDDFEVIEEHEGGYRRVMKFTTETLKKAYHRMMGSEAQSNEPSGPRFIYKKITASRVIESDYVAQGDVYGDSIIDVAYKNMYQMVICKGEHSCVVGQIVFIRDTCALMPHHYDRDFNVAISEGLYTPDYTVKLINASNDKLFFDFKLADFMLFKRANLPDDDVSLIEFPRSVRAHRDIYDKFITDADIRSLTKIRVRLDTVEGDGNYIHRSRHMAATRKDCRKISSNFSSYVLATGFEYLGYTKKGDCGGVVGLEEAPDKQCRRILGIHVAGEPTLGVGLCAIITQEKLDNLFKNFSVVSDAFYESQADMKLADVVLPGTFISLNYVEKPHNLNPSSALIRTRLFGKWGRCAKVPAPLKPFLNTFGKKINPMLNAITPYSTSVKLLDDIKVSRAAYHAFSRFRKLTTEAQRFIFSFEQAVAGICGTSINGIPRNTSPGYPYVLSGHTNKKKFFGKGDEYTFTSPECASLMTEVERILKDASRGVRNTHIFIDFLKDELRSLEKAEIGATRLISSAPLAYVIAFRMMFLSFTSAVQDTRIRNGVAVGINAYTEWDYLANEMSSKGPDCVAGDFKGFDSSEQPDVHWAILDQINSWYDDGPDNAMIRKVLWMEVVHSRHLGGLHGKLDTVYQWNKSLPSGHPATSIINSFYNLTVFNMAWVDIMGVGQADKFWDMVYICVYGDDNILNISSQVSGSFNQNTISVVMSNYGMTYTSENKVELVGDTRTLQEISFLKRGFRFDSYLHKYVGPQDLDSILYVPYWCKNKSMLDEVTLHNVEFTYLEMSLHPPDVWDNLAHQIRDSVKDEMDADPRNLFTRKEYLSLTQEATMTWPL